MLLQLLFFYSIINLYVKIGGSFMQKDLYDKVKEYRDSNPIRFHMPSHNGECIDIETAMDITELSFSDNLMQSESIIANTEKNIAKAYGSKYSLMLTTGATSGVAISLFAVKNYGSKLLLLGDTHKSVYNYAHLFNFIVTQSDNIEDINPNDFDAIVITSPDYFGKVKDIQKLKDTTAIVIVDASHGSHFPFSSKLPSLNTSVADITILSFHKTLPVLTGGAGIITNDKELYDLLCYSRNLIHSSSPSYLTMASIDKAIYEFYLNGENLYSACIKEIENFKSILCDRYSVLETDDITRLCICAKNIDCSKIAKALEQKNIYIEMTYYDIMVAIVTPYNYKHLITFANALNQIEIYDKTTKLDIKKPSKIDINDKKIIFENVKDCTNKICASNIGIYPPGTPLLTIGDVITKDIIKFLTTSNVEIFGLVDGKIPVFKT